MVSFEQILYIIPVLALSVSITYYAMVLRNQNITRQTQLFMQIHSSLQSPEMVKNFYDIINQEWETPEEYMEKYGPQTNPDAYSKRAHIALIFENVGILLSRGLVDITLVRDMMTAGIVQFYEKLEPVIKYVREEENNPTWNEWVEYLYKQIKPISTQRHEKLN
jgi:hypothetical protein